MQPIPDPVTALRPLNSNEPSPAQTAPDEAIMRKKAQEFEAVFIGQMLKFSGLDKALMMNGGKEASAFTGFYIEQFADRIAQKGGFGLAEKIYQQMSRIDQAEPNLEINLGANSVDTDKM